MELYMADPDYPDTESLQDLVYRTLNRRCLAPAVHEMSKVARQHTISRRLLWVRDVSAPR